MRVLGRRPLQPRKKRLQAQRILFMMQKLRALLREEVDKARATRTRTMATTQSSTLRPVVMAVTKAASALCTRECNHVHRGRDASAPPTTQLQLHVLPLSQQQG